MKNIYCHKKLRAGSLIVRIPLLTPLRNRGDSSAEPCGRVVSEGVRKGVRIGFRKGVRKGVPKVFGKVYRQNH